MTPFYCLMMFLQRVDMGLYFAPLSSFMTGTNHCQLRCSPTRSTLKVLPQNQDELKRKDSRSTLSKSQTTSFDRGVLINRIHTGEALLICLLSKWQFTFGAKIL